LARDYTIFAAFIEELFNFFFGNYGEKTSVNDNDLLLIAYSEDVNKIKKIKLSNLTTGSPDPVSGSIIRDINGFISEVDLADGNKYVVTRDINNLISSIKNNDYNWEFTRDENNIITLWSVS